MNGISSPMRRDPTELPHPFHHARIQREVCSLEEGPHLPLLAPQSQTSSLQNREKQVSVVYKPPGL